MSIVRWDPFQEMLTLREAMDHLLEQSFIRPGGMGRMGMQGAGQGLAIDVCEREDDYEVKASLPGVKPEDIHVDVMGDTLTIRAEMKEEQERRDQGYLMRERRAGTMQRSIALPAPIDSEQVRAEYQDGVLTLTLPKSPAARPRRIDIRAGSGAQGQPQITGQASGNREQQGGTATQPTSQARAGEEHAGLYVPPSAGYHHPQAQGDAQDKPG